MSRPEHQGPPELFYDEREASKYSQSSRIIQIQREMAERAFDLLGLARGEETMEENSSCEMSDDDFKDISSSGESDTREEFSPKIILDLGCGSGLSAQVIEDAGHVCIGSDISPSMLFLNSCPDIMQGDMGEGVPFRPGTVDGMISISALQWLFHSHRTRENPRPRLNALFQTLRAALSRSARAVFQFYPETQDQIQLVLECARKAGFEGGLVIDYPDSTKAKKYYLCLCAGARFTLPTALGVASVDEAEEETARIEKSSHPTRFEARKNQRNESRRDWILRKKASARKKHGGVNIRQDTKYTGRRRKIRF